MLEGRSETIYEWEDVQSAAYARLGRPPQADDWTLWNWWTGNMAVANGSVHPVSLWCIEDGIEQERDKDEDADWELIRLLEALLEVLRPTPEAPSGESLLVRYSW